MNPLGTLHDPRFRRVSTARVIEELLLGGFVFELAAGQRARAAAICADALARWVCTGLPTGKANNGGPGFNPVEVKNFMIWASLHRADPFWAEHYVTTGQNLVRQFAAAPAGAYRVSFRRTFNMADVPPEKPIRLRLPLPLTPAVGGIRFGGDQAPAPRPGDGRIDYVDSGPRAPVQAFSWDASFVANTTADPDGPDDESRAVYTRPREGLVHVSDRVTDLAQHLTNGLADPSARVMKLWRWINENLFSGTISYHEVNPDRPMDWALGHGWIDCHIGAALLVSLARSLGFPARIVGGHLLYGLSPYQHFWAEIWIADRGWVPFDLSSWSLSGGGRDAGWRDCFAGRLDARLTMQILPRRITGPVGVPLPSFWYFAAIRQPGGIRGILENAENGNTVYTDDISVSPAPSSANATPL